MIKMLLPELYPIIVSFVEQRVLVKWRTVSKLFRKIIDDIKPIPFANFEHSNPQYRLFPSVDLRIYNQWKVILCSAIQRQDIISLRTILEKDPDRILKRAGYFGDSYLISLSLKYGANRYDQCCDMAAYNNHKEMVIELLKYRDKKYGTCSSSSSGALYSACRGGHKELALLLLEEHKGDAEQGAEGACKGNNQELMELMIVRGKVKNFESIFWTACKEDHCVDLLLTKYIHGYEYTSGLKGACEGGHLHLVKLMLESGALTAAPGFWFACHNGNLECILFTLKYSDDKTINEGFSYLCSSGHKEVADLLLSKGVVKETKPYNDYFVTGKWTTRGSLKGDKRVWDGPYKDNI